MKMKNRITSLVLSAMMCSGICLNEAVMDYIPQFSISANAEGLQEYNNLYYEYNGNITIVGIKGDVGNKLVIPQEIDGHPVTQIGTNAFGAWEAGAEYSKKITSIVLPDTIERIGENAFSGLSIKTLNLPASLECIIGSYGEISAMGINCSTLESVSVSVDSPYFYSIDGVLFNKANNTLAAYPHQKAGTEYSIPEGTEGIGTGAFSGNTTLEKIYIPNGIKTIEKWAFNSCTKLKEIIIPDSVTTIGERAFESCNNLESIKLSENLDSIPYMTFASCLSLKSIDIPDSVTSIGISAFEFCTSLEQVRLSENLISIDERAFEYNYNLTEIDLPARVSQIGKRAFIGSDNIISLTVRNPDCKFGVDLFTSIVNYEYERNTIIKGYADSTAYEFATQYGFEFEDIGNPPQTYCLKFSDGKEEEVFDFKDTIESNLGSPTEYNPKLAHKLITLSSSIYDDLTDLKYNYAKLGFSFVEDHRCNRGLPLQIKDVDNVGYCFGRKTLSDGKKLILITVRGTRFFSVNEWVSDFRYTKITENYHDGFYTAFEFLWNDLTEYVGGYNNLSDYQFVVTGHSRGAAVANILERELIDKGISVYGYNFAVPDVACLKKSQFTKNEYDSIFNLSYCNDPVSKLPGEAGDIIEFYDDPVNVLKGNLWGKFGKTYWYAKNWKEDCSAIDNPFSHSSERYVSFFANRYNISNGMFKSKGEKYLFKIRSWGSLLSGKICCPVNVTFKDEEGNVLATVIDEEINYTELGAEKIAVWLVDDMKCFEMKDNTKVHIETEAYDTGSMTILTTADDDYAVMYSVPLDKVGQGYSLESVKDSNEFTLTSDNGKVIPYTDTVLRGDVNRDNKVNVADLVVLNKYVLGSSDCETVFLGDMCPDEQIDIFDVVEMRKRLVEAK